MAYEVRGDGSRPIVLLHGLLLNRKMHYPLADDLAARGNRVILIDLLGHGESSRPRDMWRYSMPIFGEQVVALLDHLELENAVVGGTSLGANVTLEVAARAPERVRGMVIEMPVLDNALLACAITFTPTLVALTFGAPLARALATVAQRVPRGIHPLLDIPLDTISQDPGPSSAVLQGLFFGRAAPPRHERREMQNPAIVFGHTRDLIHPFSDAQMLARELPNGRIVEANSIIELRLRPERLTNVIARFLEECWRTPRKAGRRARAAASASRAAG